MARAALAACAPPLRALACGAPAPTGASAADALRHPSLRPLLAALLRDAGDALAEQCGGSSGLLYAILLRSAAGALLTQPQQQQRAPAAAPDSLQGYSEAFLAALAGVGVAANSRPGQRSMLDALHPAACALAGGGAAGGLCAEVLEGVAAAASAGAGATAAMAPVAGRSCWVAPEVARGVQDPGAAAAAAWVGAVAGALKELLGAAGAGQAPAQ
jgi:dihydroxyacetone kinase